MISSTTVGRHIPTIHSKNAEFSTLHGVIHTTVGSSELDVFLQFFIHDTRKQVYTVSSNTA